MPPHPLSLKQIMDGFGIPDIAATALARERASRPNLEALAQDCDIVIPTIRSENPPPSFS